MEDSCPGKLSLLAYRPMNKDLTQFVCLESNGHNSSTESHYNEHDYSCGKIESPVEGDLDLATNYEQCTEEVVQDGEWGADIEFIFAEEEPSPDPLEDELDEEQENQDPLFNQNLAVESSNNPTLTRKKKVQTLQWQANSRKVKRQSGQEYTTPTGKVITDKKPKSVQCTCNFNCTAIVSEDERYTINREYWELDDNAKQLAYLSTVIKMNSCQRKLNKESRRAKTIDYYLKEKRVCKKFFLATLNISDGRITVWKKKQESEEPYTDKRGRHSNHRICDPDVVAKINAHIQSLPVMESHYARANTHKLYLAANLSINEMYRLFVKKYGKICLPYKYRKEFCANYNYSFHRPKKDGCVTCERYKLAEDKGPLEAGYTQHNQNRELAKALKKADKDSAKQDSSTKVYTFDMQAVLTTPC